MCVLGTSCMSWERRMVTMKPTVILLLRLMYSRTDVLHGNVLRHIIFLLFSFLPPHFLAAPNVDISLQSGQLSATSIASFRERLLDFRSCWIVFVHVVRLCKGVLVVSYSSPMGKLLRSRHLFRLAFSQCGRTGRNAVLYNNQKVWLPGCLSHLIVPKMVVPFDSY